MGRRAARPSQGRRLSPLLVSRRTTVLGAAGLSILLLLLAACGADSIPDYQAPERAYSATVVAPEDQNPAEQEYVRALLARDPGREVLLEAFVREQRLLGIVVRDNARAQALRDLLLGLALEMAAAFPHRDIEVIAYNEGDDQAIARAVYRDDTGKTVYETRR